MTASFHVLTTGYADTRVAGTVTLLVDGATVAIVDPGMVADRRSSWTRWRPTDWPPRTSPT